MLIVLTILTIGREKISLKLVLEDVRVKLKQNVTNSFKKCCY